MNFSSCSRAFPESIISLANLTPSSRESTLPATYNPAAEFKTTVFLLGPFSPFKIDKVIYAFTFESPPMISSLLHLFIPKSSLHSKVFKELFHNILTYHL